MERNLPLILLHPIQNKCCGFISELKPELKPRHLFWIGGVVCSHIIHGELLHVCYSHLQLLLMLWSINHSNFVFLEIVNLMPRFLCSPSFVKCFPDSWHFWHDHIFPSSCNVFLDITPTTIARMFWRSINADTFDMIISNILLCLGSRCCPFWLQEAGALDNQIWCGAAWFYQRQLFLGSRTLLT